MTRVVAIIGPSKAGKTTLLEMLGKDPAKWGLPPFEILDLDDKLGPSNRSDVPRAVDLVRSYANKVNGLLLVNVGAGQIVQKHFREFLQSAPGMVIAAVWCDERTFRKRHGPETADREYENNHTNELSAIWQRCRDAGHMVNTSCPAREAESLVDLVRILLRTTTA